MGADVRAVPRGVNDVLQREPLRERSPTTGAEARTAQPLRAQARREAQRIVERESAMLCGAPIASEPIVREQSGAHEPRRAPSIVERQQELQRSNEVRRGAEERIPFQQGIAHETQLKVLKVAK